VRAGESGAGARDNVVQSSPPVSPSVLLPATVVTKENLEQVLVGSGYLKREQIFK
jgi:hypothetical protein